VTDAPFDAATAVRPHDDGRTFDVTIDPAWTIGPDKPNGGYLLALLGRAAVAAVRAAGGEQPFVVAANVQYVRSPSVGDAVIEVDVARIGRTASQATVQLRQDGAVCVQALCTLGRLEGGADPWWGSSAPPDVAPEDACARPFAMAPATVPTIRQRVSVLFDPSVGFTTGEPSGTGELKGWLRFADGRDPDPLSLLLFCDAFPPATFDVVRTGWVPTLNLTVYVRAVPAPGPLRMRFRAGIIAGGFADEVCEIWDSADRLVAQSTQLTALRLPPPA